MRSTSHAKERILLYGGPGAGKSYSWADVANWERRTGENKMYVVNTDPGRVDRLEDEFPDLGHNVGWEDAWGYQSVVDGLESGAKGACSTDWLVLDMVDLLYDWTQDFFLEETLSEGGDAASFMLEYRKKSEQNPITEQGGWGINWQIVKRLYRSAMARINQFPGHVIVCTPAAPIRQPDSRGRGGDDKDLMSIFGKWGVKPAGEKRLGHSFPTVLLLGDSGKGRIYNTVRDNNRAEVKGHELNSFTQDYLIDVAGWEM